MIDKIHIAEEASSKELVNQIYQGFCEHSIEKMGYDGNIQQYAFVARNEKGDMIGAAVVKTFWGALHIKYLYLKPNYRGKGIGKSLMDQAFKKGLQLACRFAFVETMSFQALDFYKNLGFQEEFVRKGYDKKTSFHYLKKALNPQKAT